MGDRVGAALFRTTAGVLAVSLSAFTASMATAGSASATTVTIAAGSLDTGLNGSGTVLQSGSATAQSVAVVPTYLSTTGAPLGTSGDILVAGFNNQTTAPASTLYEYSPAGSLVGSASLPNFDAEAVAVSWSSPGAALTIAVAGWSISSTNACTNPSKHAAAIETFNGSLSPSVSGINEPDCPQTSADTSQFNAVTIDPSGLPIAAGMVIDGGTGHIPATLLARFTSAGALDPSFGNSGFEETNVIANTSEANGVAVEQVSSADEIFVTGQAQFGANTNPENPFAAAFNASGSPLDTFGPGYQTNTAPGMVSIGDTGEGNGIALISNPTGSDNGYVVIGGEIDETNGPVNALFEWDPNGNPASGFGATGNGQAIDVPGNLSSISAWNDIAYEPTGDFLLAAGYAGSNREMVVSEFNATSGHLNSAYGQSGSTVKSFGNQSGFLNSVAMAADGSAITAGAAPPVGNATEAYLMELYGTALTVSVGSATYSSSAPTATVTFTVTLGQALSTPATTTLCYSVSGGANKCTTVPINAGQTVVPITETITTGSVGTAVTVNVTAVNNGGVGAVASTPPATTSVQHYAPIPYDGYWMVTTNGAIYNFGHNVNFYGGENPNPVAPIVGMAVTPSGNGYWLVTSTGRVYNLGGATNYGSVQSANSPIVGIAATTTGNGYWVVNAKGAVFGLGGAKYQGGANTLGLTKPIAGIVANPAGGGYWLFSSNGGVFNYGAGYYGAASQYHPVQPIVGMAAYPGAGGYWMVTNNGGVFSFGAAVFHGAATPYHPTQPIIGIASNASGSGYWLAEANGGLFSFDVPFFGPSTAAQRPVSRVVGIVG